MLRTRSQELPCQTSLYTDREGKPLPQRPPFTPALSTAPLPPVSLSLSLSLYPGDSHRFVITLSLSDWNLPSQSDVVCTSLNLLCCRLKGQTLLSSRGRCGGGKTPVTIVVISVRKVLPAFTKPVSGGLGGCFRGIGDSDVISCYWLWEMGCLIYKFDPFSNANWTGCAPTRGLMDWLYRDTVDKYWHYTSWNGTERMSWWYTETLHIIKHI